MSSQPTAKAIAAHESRLALVVHPGTTQQRALETVDTAIVAQQLAALRRAAASHPGEPLGWLSHATGVVVPILPTHSRSSS